MDSEVSARSIGVRFCPGVVDPSTVRDMHVKLPLMKHSMAWEWSLPPRAWQRLPTAQRSGLKAGATFRGRERERGGERERGREGEGRKRQRERAIDLFECVRVKNTF